MLRSAGVFTLASQLPRRRNSLLILCYHGLSLYDEHQWLPHLYISPEFFRQRLACLRDLKASVLPLNEALERLRTESLPPRSVVITFDDGFYDFLLHGVPVISDFGYPCTLYLTTYYSQFRLPVISLVLDYVLWKSGQECIELPMYELCIPVHIRTYEERQYVVRQILKRMDEKQLETAAKDAEARLIAKSLDIDYDEVLRRRIVQILSSEEIQQVARAGIDIQLHTHRHRAPRNRELFIREIQDNATFIRGLTGKQAVHFCYPSGDYSPEFFAWLRECGVQSATTCEKGLATSASSPMLLPRVLDDSTTDVLRFESFVSGLFI